MRRRVETSGLQRCVCVVLVALAACARDAPPRAAGASPALPTLVEVPLDGASRRFEAQSLDSRTGMLFIADFDGGRVVVLDTATNRVVKIIRDLPSAHGILAVPELGRVYVSEPAAYEIAVIDATTYAVIARVPGGRYPAAMAWEQAGQKLYVSDVIGESETVIDTKRSTRVATIPLGGEAGDTQFVRAENLIYVSVRTKNELVAIDPALDRIVARYPLEGCSDSAGLLVDEVHQLAYVACRGNARVATFDLHSHRQRGVRFAGTDPDSLAWDAASSRLYVASERGSISIFAFAGGGLRNVSGGVLCDDAHSIAVNPVTHRLYFATHDAGDRPIIRVMQGANASSPVSQRVPASASMILPQPSA